MRLGSGAHIQSVGASGNTNSYFNYDVTANGKSFLEAATGGTATSTNPATPPLTVRVNWQPAPKQ